jgi:CheY-like chemotaxis protein/anti-sigma regulatory factor (Ser/Thr protein kinase)
MSAHLPPSDGVGNTAQTLLIVDDSAVDRHLAETVVNRRTAWRILHAGSGVEALACLRGGGVRVVLADVLMPEMDGLGLVEAVREQFPHIPVVLMTAHGSEDLAIQALRAGAASYVPKRSLNRYLGDTLEQVLETSHTREQQQRVEECLSCLDRNFLLDTDPSVIPHLVANLQEMLRLLRVGDGHTQMRVAIALEEALLNGLYHGNLELSSDLRQDGSQAYQRAGEQRRRLSPYRERRLYVTANVSRSEAVFQIRDEGPGFDLRTLPDPTDPSNIGKASGRGLLLIRTFMDEVRHNPSGNQITLVKRQAQAG